MHISTTPLCILPLSSPAWSVSYIHAGSSSGSSISATIIVHQSRRTVTVFHDTIVRGTAAAAVALCRSPPLQQVHHQSKHTYPNSTASSTQLHAEADFQKQRTYPPTRAINLQRKICEQNVFLHLSVYYGRTHIYAGQILHQAPTLPYVPWHFGA